MGEARTSLLLGLLAGLGFGGFFIALARTGPASGLWPLFAARLSSLFATAIAAALSGMFSASGRGLRKEDRPAAFGAGLFDMGANVAFLLACRSDLLIIVTVLSSLFPAPTVLLARIVYGQRVSPARLAGLVLAIAGVALIGIRG
jgi:drug/metabolite transporter (DMT)-like permease